MINLSDDILIFALQFLDIPSIVQFASTNSTYYKFCMQNSIWQPLATKLQIESCTNYLEKIKSLYKYRFINSNNDIKYSNLQTQILYETHMWQIAMCNTLIVPGGIYQIAFQVISMTATENKWNIILGLVYDGFPLLNWVPGTRKGTYGIGITSKTFIESSKDYDDMEREVFKEATSGTTYGMKLDWTNKQMPQMTLYQDGKQVDTSVLKHLIFDKYRFCVAILRKHSIKLIPWNME